MAKRTVFSTISPLPAGVSREVVLNFLHNHTEMIDLNPLVIERHYINPPANADPDEQKCVWYSMTDKIDYVPGGKFSGDVSYTCAFHDLANGIQTHCRAPLGVDIRDKWTLNGSLPGEPPEPPELGIGAPASGLYIREDVDLRCNVLMTRFVKKNLMKSHAALVDKLVEKATEISAQRKGGAPNSGRLSPQSIVPAVAQPWSPSRTHPTTAASPGFQNSVQEARSPSTQSSTQFIGAYQTVRHPASSYSQTSSYPVPPLYKAPSHHTSPMQSCSEYRPALRMPSQQHPQAQQASYDEYPPAIRPLQQNYRQSGPASAPASPPYPDDQDFIQRCRPPYLDDQDATPAPLRIGGGGQDQAVNTASSSSVYTLSSRSRSSSEIEHPLYPHLSPYSSVLSDRSSSPDEPLTPESVRAVVSKEYFGGRMDHPDVLRPGNGRLKEWGPFDGLK